jgi:hypothetical protein
MILHLTDEQRKAIATQEGSPIFLDDQGQRYVLVPAEVYQRIQSLVDAAQFDIKDTYAAAEEVLGAAGWDDPALDAYNDYDAHRSQT